MDVSNNTYIFQVLSCWVGSYAIGYTLYTNMISYLVLLLHVGTWKPIYLVP